MLKWWQDGDYSEIAYIDIISFKNGTKISIILLARLNDCRFIQWHNEYNHAQMS